MIGKTAIMIDHAEDIFYGKNARRSFIGEMCLWGLYKRNILLVLSFTSVDASGLEACNEYK